MVYGSSRKSVRGLGALFATLRERYGLIGFRDEIYYFKKSMDGYVAISEPSKNFDSEAVKVKEHE